MFSKSVIGIIGVNILLLYGLTNNSAITEDGNDDMVKNHTAQ